MSACLPHTELPCWINKFEHATYFSFLKLLQTHSMKRNHCVTINLKRVNVTIANISTINYSFNNDISNINIMVERACIAYEDHHKI